MKRTLTVAAVGVAGAAFAAFISLMVYLFLVFVPGPGFKTIDDAATEKEKAYEKIASPVALFVFIGGSIGAVGLGIVVTRKNQNKHDA